MPPDSPSEFEYTVEDHVLSDQNVAVLYKIVENAEAQSNVETQPFRALFAAYESVLPEHGLQTAHDRIYLRFLFRLGQKRQQEESLFESFEGLLQELGIQLEFKDDGSVSRAEDGALEELGYTRSQNRSPRRRSRRASFGDVDDETEGTNAHVQERHRLRAVSQEAPKTPNRDNAQRPRVMASTNLGRTSLPPTPWSEGAKDSNGQTPLSTQGHHLRTREDETEGSAFEFERVDNHVPTQPNATQQALSPTSAVHNGKFGEVSAPSFPHLHQPSRTQLFRDAETFQQYRIRAVVRDVIDRWCDAAWTAHRHHEHLHRLAVAQDTEILVRQAFVHWRTRLHARRSAVATNKFFDRLEKRALRARDLYLLTKALTHWAQTALDEKRQRLAARQRILATKYFYAWHEITIENQGKQKDKLLKTHFGVWKQLYVTNLKSEYQAEWHRDNNLVKSVYWHWFWSFCQRRAPEWHDRKLKQRYFVSWLKQPQVRRLQTQSINHTRDLKIKEKVFLQWSAKTRKFRENEQKADEFNIQNGMSLAIRDWRRETHFLPLQSRLSNMADWRIAGTTFAIFVNRFRFEKEAEKLDHLRKLRSLWKHWNDQLRSRTLIQRIDRNFLLTALYRWVIATRFSLIRRLFDEREKARLFDRWRRTIVESRASSAPSLDQWKATRRSVFLRDAFLSWRSQSSDHHRNAQIAHEFHTPKLAVETLMLWKDNLKSKRHAREAAEDARYFFIARRVLKLWRKRTQESKRQKRRDAYALIRRRIKMRIAAEALQIWRDRKSQVAGQMTISRRLQRDRVLLIGTTLFDKWRQMIYDSLDRDSEALGRLEQSHLRRSMGLWIHQTELRWEQEETATANHDLHVQKTAFICLRKLRLRLIELRGQQGKGEVLKTNHDKRHQRILLCGWRDKTSIYHKRILATPALPAKSRGFRRYRGIEDLGATRRAEEWTELETQEWAPSLEAQASSTPLPGYLSTPSKRASRAKAIVQSTTPLGTPFQSRLRAQLNTTPRFSRFGSSSKSRLGIAPVGSVLEESPLVPDTQEAGNDD